MHRKTTVSLLKLLISLVALAVAFRGLDGAKLAGAIASAPKGGLVLGFALYFLSQTVSAMRWRLLVVSGGLALPRGAAVRYYLSGMFLSLLGPGFLGGDLARAVFLVRRHGATPSAAATVVVDRYAGLVWLTVFASVSFLTLGRQGLPVQVVFAVHACAAVALATWIHLPRLVAVSRGFFPGTGDRGSFDLLAWWREVPSRHAVTGMSLSIHFLQVSATVALARAIVPDCPWQYCFVFHPLVATLSAIPLSVAGLGIREASYVYFLSIRPEVSREDAGTFALAWLAVVMASALVGAAVFLFASGKPPPLSGEEGHSPETHSPRSS